MKFGERLDASFRIELVTSNFTCSILYLNLLSLTLRALDSLIQSIQNCQDKQEYSLQRPLMLFGKRMRRCTVHSFSSSQMCTVCPEIKPASLDDLLS